MITISKEWIRETMVGPDDETVVANGYWALNGSGRGQVVAVIDGPVKIVDFGYGTDGGELADGTYALRDIIAFAQRGEHGLSIHSK